MQEGNSPLTEDYCLLHFKYVDYFIPHYFQQKPAVQLAYTDYFRR